MPRVKLDETKTYRQGWGVYSYMLHALKTREDGSVSIFRPHLRILTSGITKSEAIAYAEKYSTHVHACLPFFNISLKTSYFGDMRSKGFIGYSIARSSLKMFEKPLQIWAALKEIERKEVGA